MTYRWASRIAVLLLPLLLGIGPLPRPVAPAAIHTDLLQTLGFGMGGAFMLPCQIDDMKTFCLIDTGDDADLTVPGSWRLTGPRLGSIAVQGVTGLATVQVLGATLTAAGQSVAAEAEVLPNYNGPPLIGLSGLAKLHDILVLDWSHSESGVGSGYIVNLSH